MFEKCWWLKKIADFNVKMNIISEYKIICSNDKIEWVNTWDDVIKIEFE